MRAVLFTSPGRSGAFRAAGLAVHHLIYSQLCTSSRTWQHAKKPDNPALFEARFELYQRHLSGVDFSTISKLSRISTK